MRGSIGLGLLLTVLAALSSSSVFAWPSWLPHRDALVAVRQDDGPTTTRDRSAAQTTKPSATKSDDPPPDEPETTNLNTGGRTPTATGTQGGKGGSASGSRTTARPTHTTFNVIDQPGRVVMQTPKTTAGKTSLYKIGETITWQWNYTSLQGTPTAVDVLASCSAASKTWTLTQNMSYETTGSYTWDTDKYRQTAVESPLLTELYTLVIYDSDRGIDATAESGYLAVFKTFTFGLYTARPYANLSNWTCTICSGASRELDAKALQFAMTMGLITVLSFTWFVTGFAGSL